MILGLMRVVGMWINCSSITLGEGLAEYIFRFLGPSSDQLDLGLWAGPENLYFNLSPSGCCDTSLSFPSTQGPGPCPSSGLTVFHIINNLLKDPALL